MNVLCIIHNNEKNIYNNKFVADSALNGLYGLHSSRTTTANENRLNNILTTILYIFVYTLYYVGLFFDEFDV